MQATNSIPRCFSCGDLGFDLSKEGIVSTCWRVKAKAPHNPPSDAAVMVGRALHAMLIEKVAVDRQLFDVVKTLIRFTSAVPCTRQQLIEGHFDYSPAAVRNCQAAIETLRRVWLLPVGSRKEAPSGYWIVTDAADFAAYFDRAKSAPVTQLTTIYRVAKRNFPIFAEQIELDFWNDVSGKPDVARAA